MADAGSIFSAQTPEPEVPLDIGLNDLVGEAQKYKTPDDLAKAYAHLERHSRQLEAENAEARAARDRLEATQRQPNPPIPGQETPPAGDNPPVIPPKAPPSGDVDFRSQIREEVKALNETERAVANMEAAASKMVEVYGSPTEANKAVKQKAQELGVSVEWLQDSASRSPAAFYATMGINTQGGNSRTTPASGGGVNMQGSGGNVENFEYFDKIRREDPKTYFSAATQSRMMRQARTMGSDFYKR